MAGFGVTTEARRTEECARLGGRQRRTGRQARSDRATYAQASLTETLRMMSARIKAPMTLQLLGKSLSPDQILADPTMSAALAAALQTFMVSIHESRHP